jgi:8-oxo-dGTP pyrophosphatase MutT (NUDIX family)
MKFDTLYHGKFIDLISPKEYPYECLHEKDNVIIIPIIDNKVGIRSEFCPPYFVKGKTDTTNYYTVISGGKEDNEDIKDTSIRELMEEAGIIIKEAKLYRIYEDIAFVKNTDMKASLTLLLISKYDKEEAKGDGTENEDKSKTIWVTLEELDKVLKKDNIDALLFFCSLIIKQVLK